MTHRPISVEHVFGPRALSTCTRPRGRGEKFLEIIYNSLKNGHNETETYPLYPCLCIPRVHPCSLNMSFMIDD